MSTGRSSLQANDREADAGTGPPSHETAYLARLEELTSAAEALETLLSSLQANCEQLRRELSAGRPIFDVVSAVGDEAGRAFRRDVHAATRRFERAMQATRGQSFRILIDESGRTVTEVAR